MVSGIHNLRSLISGPVLSAYVDPESLAALIVWADGGRRKWWRKWRCRIVCVRTLCNGLLPCGSGGCKSDGKSGESGGKSGAAAVKFLSASVSGGVFLCGSKQEQKYFRNATLVITYFYISAADTGWSW